MPFNGSGTFTVYTPGNPISNGDTSNAVYFNNTMTDFATGLSNTLTKDGQSVPTANIPMGNNKLIGLANGTVSTDAAAYGQVTAGITTASLGTQAYLTSVSGTNTITASLTGLTAYTTGLTVRFTAAGANTGAVTLNIGSLGAIAVVRSDGVALAAGDLLSSGTYEAVYDGTSFKLQGSISASQIQPPPQLQSIDYTLSGNALTLRLNPTTLSFRSTTLTSGTPVSVSNAAQITTTISSGSTGGTINGISSDIIVLAINNAGTMELAWTNLAGGLNLDETTLINTTAEGGGGAADSANVIYSTTARTGVAFRVVGMFRSTQTTAGTWAQSPSLVQPMGGQALTAMSSIGYGQKWTDVSGSRALSTTYYNTTGKPIQLWVILTFTGSGGSTITINGTGYTGPGGSGATANQSHLVALIIPNGVSYAITTSSASISQWNELK